MPPSHEDFLRALGADGLGHSGQDLLSHLLAVGALLQAWGAPERLRLAGLYHSVYGTESYARSTLDLALRDRLQAQIGDEAERLAFLFGVMEKESLYATIRADPPHAVRCRLTGERHDVSPPLLAELCELTVANWLEQRPRAGPARQRHRAAELRAMRPRLSASARAALDAAYGFEE